VSHGYQTDDEFFPDYRISPLIDSRILSSETRLGLWSSRVVLVSGCACLRLCLSRVVIVSGCGGLGLCLSRVAVVSGCSHLGLRSSQVAPDSHLWP
jgi:hypothetical protein